VLIASGREFTDYPLLRATLDKLLVNRLPDVEYKRRVEWKGA